MVRSMKKNYGLEFIFLLFGSGMIFYQLFPPIVVSLTSMAFFTFCFYSLKARYSVIETLVLLTIIGIPTSMISILGISYSIFPLTWYTTFILCSIFLIILTGKLRKSYFLSITFFAIIEFTLCLMANSFTDAMKQYLMIISFLFVFFIGEYLKVNVKNDCFYNDLRFLYLIGVFCVANQVLFQKFYILITGSVIGHYIIMGQSRVAYGGIMGDFSFATLYLASGCLLILLLYLNDKRFKFWLFFISESFLLLSMLVVSSRTGIVSLVITVVLYFIFNFKKIPKRMLVVLALGCTGVPILIDKILSSRGGQALLETSGRSENYLQSITFWLEKPLFGYGLGLENLYHSTGLAVPHNFFIQYLLQMGLVGLFLIIIPFIIFITNDVLGNNYSKWLFLLVVIGSMFIPDIVSSRFLYGIVLLCTIENRMFDYNNLEVLKSET